MKNSTQLALGLLVAVSLAASNPASAAVELGGVNGWSLSTDGIVDLYASYVSTTKLPSGPRSASLLGGNTSSKTDYFGEGIGLLPSVIAFNIKAPTTHGIDSNVRVGIYSALQNTTVKNSDGSINRFDTSPNIDFREFFYTAKGAYGELLVGRALNLYQGKNILTDMTLLGAGVVQAGAHNTTLGHIGYGYLYANFGPQFRYTTPDFNGTKVAVSLGEPYAITADTGKANTPRIEAEVSYAKTYGGTAVQAWLSGLYEKANRSNTALLRPGQQEQSVGGAAGVGAGFSGVNLLLSGYGGKGLGMLSAQDGSVLGADATTDAAGNTRKYWGFLAQATYALTSDVVLGINYGQSRQELGEIETTTPMKNQEAATSSVTYSLNKFIKFTGEYTYAQNTWHDGAKQHSNQFSLGSTFFW
jgi:hypothetical protein